MKDAKFLLLGITFTENCPDIRNTKVVDIYHTLSQYSSDITVYDPWANPESVQRAYGIQIQNHLPQQQFDAVILCVAHSQFLQLDVRSLVRGNGVVYDVKGVLDRHVIDARL